MTIINCRLPILNWKGEAATMENGPGATVGATSGAPRWEAGKFLAQILATSDAVRPEDSAKAMSLAMALETRSEVEISSGEGVLIGQVLIAARLAPWIRASLTYLTDPASLGGDRTALEIIYSAEETARAGNKSPGENGAASKDPGGSPL